MRIDSISMSNAVPRRPMLDAPRFQAAHVLQPADRVQASHLPLSSQSLKLWQRFLNTLPPYDIPLLALMDFAAFKTSHSVSVLDIKSPVLKSRREVITFPAMDGTMLKGWFIPPQNGKPTILVLPGRTGNVGMKEPLLENFVSKGYGCMVFKYRGFDKENKVVRASEQTLTEDFQAAADYLKQQGVERRNTIVLAHSLGTAIAVRTLAQDYQRDEATGRYQLKPDTQPFRLVLFCAPITSTREVGKLLRQSELPRILMEKIKRARLSDERASELSQGLASRINEFADFLHLPDLVLMPKHQTMNSLDIIHRITRTPMLFIMGGKDAWAPPAMGNSLYGRVQGNDGVFKHRIVFEEEEHSSFFGLPENDSPKRRFFDSIRGFRRRAKAQDTEPSEVRLKNKDVVDRIVDETEAMLHRTQGMFMPPMRLTLPQPEAQHA